MRKNVMALLLLLLVGGCHKSHAPELFNEAASGDEQIASAAQQAGAAHKLILVQFGANWCGWCRKLHQLLASNPEIQKELGSHFVMVLVNADSSQNRDLLAKYAPHRTALSLPFLVILKPDGKLLLAKKPEEFIERKSYQPSKILTFLRALPNS
jgi:thioredoxin-related protein